MAEGVAGGTSSAVKPKELLCGPLRPPFDVCFAWRVNDAEQASGLSISQEKSGERVDGLVRVFDVNGTARVAALEIPNQDALDWLAA